MELIDAVKVLGALAQPARLQVFRLLVARGSEGMCAGDLSNELEIPKNTMSFHLKELQNAGMIVAERNGRSINYRLQEDGIRDLMQFLTEDCCQGRPELCMPKSSEDENCVTC